MDNVNKGQWSNDQLVVADCLPRLGLDYQQENAMTCKSLSFKRF